MWWLCGAVLFLALLVVFALGALIGDIRMYDDME